MSTPDRSGARGRIRHYVRQLRRIGVAEAASIGRKRITAIPARIADARRCTHSRAVPPPAAPLFEGPVPVADADHPSVSRAAIEAYLEHRFDLLGSGWVRVRHGMECAGFEGLRRAAASPVRPTSDGGWLRGRVPAGSLREARRVWSLVDPGHTPIDWLIDFRSGYRWSARKWYRDVPVSPARGADIKVPWELGRLQHLPQMALAYARARGGEPPFADRLLRGFRNQVLDFVAANPPRFGPHWHTSMEVGIRVANLVLAAEIFRASGAAFDEPFARILRRAVHDHGAHVASNLEWHPSARGNHYLANLAGLLFAGTYSEGPAAERWLVFAAHELCTEIRRQFHPEGSNFEASTAYHVLSGELAVWSVALLAGIPGPRREALSRGGAFPLGRGVPRARAPFARYPLHELESGMEMAWLRGRLQGIGRFAAAATAPGGRLIQVGDNDSGRLFRLDPRWFPGGPGGGAGHLPEEDLLECGGLLAAVAALLQPSGGRDRAVTARREGAVLGSLARGSRLAAEAGPPALPLPAGSGAGGAPARSPDRRIEFRAPGAALRESLRCEAYPAFGLYLWRGPTVFAALRCGSIGQEGRGGHAHNDQLALELCIRGEPWVTDPGSYVYTASPEARDRFRSSAAHFTPALEGREPGSLDLGMFRLGDGARAECIRFDETVFIGRHHGYGAPTVRRVTLADEAVIVEDWLPDAGSISPTLLPDVPFSPSYGRLLRGPLRVPLRVERDEGTLVVTREPDRDTSP